jgi:hypothetical protein
LGSAGDDEGVERTGVWDAAGGTGERIELCKTRRALLQLTPVTPVFGLRAGFLPSEPSRLIIRLGFHPPPPVVFGPFPSLDLTI